MHRCVVTLCIAGLAILTWNAYGAEELPLIKHRRRIELNDGVIRSVAFSPKGKTFAACGSHLVQLFDVHTGERVERFEGHANDVLSVAFSPDGTLLASSGKEPTIRLWSLHGGTSSRPLDSEDAVRRDRINAVAFLPDGKTLVSCSPDSSHQNQIQLWDVERGWWTYRARMINPREPLDLAVSPDGKLIAVGEKPGIVILWEVVQFGIRTRFPEDRTRRSDREFRMHHDDEKAVSSVAFSSDGKLLLSSGWDNTARVWDVETGRLSLTLNGPKDARAVQAALFSRDDSRIVSVTRHGLIQIWDATNGKLLTNMRGRERTMWDLAISPDGDLLATCGAEGVVELWDVRINSGMNTVSESTN